MGPGKQYGLIHVKHIKSAEECPRLQAVTILQKDRKKGRRNRKKAKCKRTRPQQKEEAEMCKENMWRAENQKGHIAEF